ncbi:hypothetical protein CC80DRAFT_134817 [Byssothecium circinans]|uniref:Uncharacterized protein n=1 Tax=Byssothecium circinans TaxID=147558 RepID=A0A6A5TPT3_9PLEO|nr:hypothetical protein CC80DRAFT_134817 [Byssothecium circinans]
MSLFLGKKSFSRNKRLSCCLSDCHHLAHRSLTPTTTVLPSFFIVIKMFGLKGGAVGVPRWILAFRALQFLFAILVIALSAYALSIYRGGPVCHLPSHFLLPNPN